jgi:hypothetical protein
LALAVLVQWLRQTPNAQGLHFKNVPEKMLKIIQACHLQDDLTLLKALSIKKAPNLGAFFIYNLNPFLPAEVHHWTNNETIKIAATIKNSSAMGKG